MAKKKVKRVRKERRKKINSLTRARTDVNKLKEALNNAIELSAKIHYEYSKALETVAKLGG